MATSAAAAQRLVNTQQANHLSQQSSLEEKSAREDTEKALSNHPKAAAEDLNGHNQGCSRIEPY